MKKTIFIGLMLTVAHANAQPFWKTSEPDMSKGPLTQLEKTIEKMPPAKMQPKKVLVKKVVKEKPGVSIGMTKKQVANDTDWGRPESARRIINSDGTWDFWYYNDETSILTFLDGELYEIETPEECE